MIAATLLLLAAQTQAPAPACPATPVALTGDLAGWVHGRAVNAAARPAGAETATLQPGVRADVALLPTAQITYVAVPGKAPAAGSFGGLLSIAATRAGTYRVALSAGAWVSVIGQDGKPLASAAHGHGPDCSGVRKIIDFALQPGRYVVQIEGSTSAAIGVMVVAKA